MLVVVCVMLSPPLLAVSMSPAKSPSIPATDPMPDVTGNLYNNTFPLLFTHDDGKTSNAQ